MSHTFVERVRSGLGFRWLWRAVLVPLLATRLALLLVGWYAVAMRPDSDYPNKAALGAGWEHSPYRWLDIWGRWDTNFYLSIARDGYQPAAGPNQQSNLAFYPLYPYTIKTLAALFPGQAQTQQLVLIGVIVSNACLVAGLALLYQLAEMDDAHGAGVFDGTDARSGETVSWRGAAAVRYFLLFPAAFFFSSVYTEGMFFFLMLLAFWGAQRQRWWLSGLAGFLAAMTRPPGILLLPALGYLYLQQRGWRWRRIDARVLWLALVPAGLGVFLALGYRLTGDWLAPFHANQAWQRSLTWPWVTLFAPLDNSRPHFNQMEWVALVVFTLLNAYIFLRRPAWRSYAVFGMLLMATLLTSGTLTSVMRASAMAFPVFLLLGEWSRRWPALDWWVGVAWFALQAVLFAGWTQFYWAG